MPPDRHGAPLIVRWDGPQDADLRRRVELAVAAGVRRAIAATSPSAPSELGRPGAAFTGWGPDPERGLWVLPSFDNGGEPVAVPVTVSVVTEAYRSGEELRNAIRDAFPATGGEPGRGVFYGIYGLFAGAEHPNVYYVHLSGGREVFDSIYLYHLPKRLRRGVKEEEQRVPLGLAAGFYTAIFQPKGQSVLMRHDVPWRRPLGNPHNLDLTVAFAVDPLHVPQPRKATWQYVPLVRIHAANPASPLATDAESFYIAFTSLWEVDEYGRPVSVDDIATIGMAPWFHWEITRQTKEVRAAPEVVHHASGYDKRSIRYTWKEPGTYRVSCTVTVQRFDVSGRPATDSREERVFKRQQLMSLQLKGLERRQQEFLEHPKDPSEQVWASSGIELLMSFEAELRKQRAMPEPNKAKISELETTIEKLRKHLYPADRSPINAFPIHAIFMERRTSQSRPVSLFLALEVRHDVEWEGYSGDLIEGVPVDKPYHWSFIDLTYPAAYRTYEGKGTTLLEGLVAAFHDSETNIRRTYPPGQVLARVTRDDLTRHGITVPANFPDVHDFVIETDSWQKDAWEWFTLGVTVVGLLALPGAIVFPALAPVLFLTGVAGAAISVASIAERVATGNFDWDTETFADLANIAGALAQVGALAAGTRTSALARAVSTADEVMPETIAGLQDALRGQQAVAGLKGALRVQRALLLTQLGTDVANGVILGYGTYQELQAVDAQFDQASLESYQHALGAAQGYQRWLQDREARINGIFANAIFNGTMVAVSAAGGAKGLRELRRTTESLGRLGEPQLRMGPEGERVDPTAGLGEGAGPVPPPAPPPGDVPPPTRWKSLRELERAAHTDKEAADVLNGYNNLSSERLLAWEGQGDPVATGMLNRRFGGAKRPYAPARPIDPAIQQRLRAQLARVRDRVEAQRQRLLAEQERLRAEGRLERPDPRLEPADPAQERTVTTRAGEFVLVPTEKEARRYRGTIAVATSDIPALHGDMFEGASPRAFGTYDPAHPIRPPETIQNPKAHGHAEQAIGQQIHDRLGSLSPEDRAAASGGTIWVHVDQEVCSACAAGLGESERAGVLQRLSELNPDILFVITAEDTSKVIRLRAGEQVP
jgi:hypothetical protein